MSPFSARVRICLVYDCLYPHTIGGAERVYRALAERLVQDGHEVTYLTLRQWEGEDAGLPGVRVIAVGPKMPLYKGGVRRVGPPVVFGAGVLRNLLVHGREYDVVHTAAFPFFSVLAAAAVRRYARYRLVVDWWEVWTFDYWREYIGPAAGGVGWVIQRLAARVRQRAFCYSRLHARRLRGLGMRDGVTVLEGAYPEELEASNPEPARDVVVFAGRHIPEKRADALLPAVIEARREVPDLRLEVFGDGPRRGQLLQQIADAGAHGYVEAPGFVAAERVDRALRTALCMALPSRREGYGLVVVEAAARGTPSVVVKNADNAATELVDDGVNGVIAESASPPDLAAAILRVREAGPPLRASTAEWFRRNAERLSLARSIDVVAASYRPSASASTRRSEPPGRPQARS